MDRFEKQFEVRDQRSRHMFRLDDAYLDNGYSAVCGQTATCIYMSLCRHADSNQESYPSMRRLMEQHGISKPTVIKAIKALERVKIIKVERKKDPKTKRQMVNVYVLLDKSEWVKPGSVVTPVDDESSDHGAIQKSSPGSVVTPGCPGKDSLPRAGSISEAEPGKENMQKPGKPDLPEVYTERSIHIEGSAAQGAAASVRHKTEEGACSEPGCSENRVNIRIGEEWSDRCAKHQPMTAEQFIEWFRRSEKRHIRIIAEFADELRLAGKVPEFRTVAQWKAWTDGAMMKHAKGLSVFDDDQLGTAMKRMMEAKYLTDFNLATLARFIKNVQK